MRSRFVIPLLAVLVVSPTSVRAQESTPSQAQPPTAQDESAAGAQRARELFRTGLTRFEARDFRGAITAFEGAAELVPSADLWFNIARSHDELGEFAEAAEYYRRYLRDRVDPPDRERVEARIAALEERAEAQRLAARRAPTTGTLDVESDVAGAEVAVDGNRVATTPLPIPLTLPAGRHDLELTREGYVPFRANVSVDPGVSTAARVTMTRMTGYRAVRGRRVFTWVLVGLGGAALGSSIGLGAHAARENRDGDRDRADRFGTYSDYALGGTLTLGVVAAIVAFVEGRSVGTERVSAP